MKILYITQYFYPEVSATSNRAYANAKFFAAAGHNVAVVTEMPNHPKGIIYDNYKGKLYCREKLDGIDILRTWIYTSPKKTFIKRIMFYVTFMFFGAIIALLNWRRFDVIYVSSPPLFVGFIGLLIKKIFPKTKFVFEVRDLWPKSAIDIGELKNKTIINFSEKFENKLYRVSNKVIAVTEGINDYINNIIPGKSVLIPNGVDLSLYETKGRTDEKFIIVYTGTLGLIHGLEIIIKAAKKLKEESDIIFQFIGDGPKKVELKKLAADYKLRNVDFIDSVPVDQIKTYLTSASVGISTTKKLELCKGTLPVKIFGYMACELPVLSSGWGESAILIDKSGAGLNSEPEKVDELVDRILWMKRNPDKISQMGKKGRLYVEKNYNRKEQAKEIENLLKSIVKK
ncbi:MAG: glycosyltransferase family 4 protein [Candidatus Cloacimonetes bacterium]|nr:glycosyltransferase family 4 protein [Candidatus Cloacimonadota bacterium]